MGRLTPHMRVLMRLMRQYISDNAIRERKSPMNGQMCVE